MDSKTKVEIVGDLRLIDDVFFEVFAKDVPACQEILRTILEDPNLVVNDVIVQSSIHNFYGRSVRLDALCTLGDGSKCNIEIQRADNDDHLRRARFNAANITVKESNAGYKFKNITDVYIVYISQFDFLGYGHTTYHIDKTIRENGVMVDDGLHEIFVNTVVKDGTDTSELMDCFLKKEFSSSKFPEVSRRFAQLKTEGGASEVCEVMERYLSKERIEAICNMIKYGVPKEKILEDYSVDDYNAALAEMEKVNN